MMTVAGRMVLLTALLLPAGASYERTVQVVARKPWTATGLGLAKDDKVQIHASGRVAVDTNGLYATPGGQKFPADERGVVPGAPTHGLLARIGQGSPFFVGAEKTFKVDDPCELFLGINECPNRPGVFMDNSGDWTVKIQVLPSSPKVHRP